MKIQPTAAHAKPKRLYQQLYVQVLIGVTLGIVVGHFWPEFGAAMKPFGDIFVKLVKMMIPPVVFCTIASGIYSMADNKEIGKTSAQGTRPVLRAHNNCSPYGPNRD